MPDLRCRPNSLGLKQILSTEIRGKSCCKESQETCFLRGVIGGRVDFRQVMGSPVLLDNGTPPSFKTFLMGKFLRSCKCRPGCKVFSNSILGAIVGKTFVFIFTFSKEILYSSPMLILSVDLMDPCPAGWCFFLFQSLLPQLRCLSVGKGESLLPQSCNN